MGEILAKCLGPLLGRYLSWDMMVTIGFWLLVVVVVIAGIIGILFLVCWLIDLVRMPLVYMKNNQEMIVALRNRIDELEHKLDNQ